MKPFRDDLQHRVILFYIQRILTSTHKKKKKEEVDSSKKMYAPWISLSNIESNLVKPSQSC